jgi:nucleoside phosphorylase
VTQWEWPECWEEEEDEEEAEEEEEQQSGAGGSGEAEEEEGGAEFDSSGARAVDMESAGLATSAKMMLKVLLIDCAMNRLH